MTAKDWLVSRRSMWLCGVLVVLVAINARAQTPEWRWSVVPYIWWSNIGGTSVVGNRTVGVGDSTLTPALAFRVEGVKRRAGFRVAGTVAGIGNPATIALVDDPTQSSTGRYDFHWATLEAHGTLQIGPYDSTSSFTVYLGVRYVRQVQQLEDPIRGDLSDTQVWVEPIEGTQYAVESGRFGLTIAGDIGGFAVGSDFTWTLRAELAFRAARGIHLTMQYLYREVQYDNKEEGAATYRWDAGVQQGWLFGAAFTLPR